MSVFRTVGFETRRCAGCGCAVSTLAGFGSLALCSFCGAGLDADHLVSVALADARAMEDAARSSTSPDRVEPGDAVTESHLPNTDAESVPSTGHATPDLSRFGKRDGP